MKSFIRCGIVFGVVQYALMASALCYAASGTKNGMPRTNVVCLTCNPALMSSTNMIMQDVSEIKNQRIEIFVEQGGCDKDEKPESDSRNLLEKIGFNGSTMGVLVGGFLTGLCGAVRWLCIAYLRAKRRKREWEEKKRKERIARRAKVLQDRKRVYLRFIRFFLDVKNSIQVFVNTYTERPSKAELEELFPTGHRQEAAQINAEMRLLASNEIAKSHLKFMALYKQVVDALPEHQAEALQELSMMLIRIGEQMRQELNMEMIQG